MNIDQVRKIVQTRTMAKIDGFRVDTFSASAIVQVYDALSPANQAKYATMRVDIAADVAFKLIARQRS